MPALEPLAGVRVVAAPDALDDAAWEGAVVSVLRIAPDEAFAIGNGDVRVRLEDPDAIVADERGFAGAWCAWADVEAHVEWHVDRARATVQQGKVAGVPAKLVLDGDRVLLVTSVAFAADLEGRLGWRR